VHGVVPFVSLLLCVQHVSLAFTSIMGCAKTCAPWGLISRLIVINVLLALLPTVQLVFQMYVPDVQMIIIFMVETVCRIVLLVHICWIITMGLIVGLVLHNAKPVLNTISANLAKLGITWKMVNV
jgi:uncharacterized membrane protein